MNTETHMSIKEKILRKIESHEVSMRPRLYFTAHLAALAATALAVLSLSVFIFNFVFFGVRLNAHDAFLGLGLRGLGEFIALLPWKLIALDAALLVLLETLARRFRFGYHLPALYLLLGIFFVTVSVGYAMDKGSGLNERLLRAADEKRLPAAVASLYESARRPFEPGSGACRCDILRIEGNVITVEDERARDDEGRKIIRVVLPKNDPRATTTSLRAGDTIFVAGDEDGDSIRAYGVKKISPERSERNLRKKEDRTEYDDRPIKDKDARPIKYKDREKEAEEDNPLRERD